MPAQLQEPGQALNVVRVQVRQEHCVDLAGGHTRLREALGGAAARVELQVYLAAIFLGVAVLFRIDK